MTMLAENPILISVLLGLPGVTLIYLAMRGAGRRALIAGGVLLLLIPVAWLVAGAIETDAEAVESLLDEMAAHASDNDFEPIYAVVHPDFPEIASRARSELPRYEFSNVRIGGINRIAVLDDQDPHEVVVDFVANARVGIPGAGIDEQNVPRRVFFRFRKTAGGWKLTDYAHRPVVGKGDMFSEAGESDWDRLLQSNTR